MRISDWSSDVCSSDLVTNEEYTPWSIARQSRPSCPMTSRDNLAKNLRLLRTSRGFSQEALADVAGIDRTYVSALERRKYSRSEEHTELQSLMRLSYAVFCLKKKKKQIVTVIHNL